MSKKDNVRVSGGCSIDEKRNDNWRTPDYIYKPIDSVFHFLIDSAADDENHRTPLYLTEEEDALSFEWTIENLIKRCRLSVPISINLYSGICIWSNPPYNKRKSDRKGLEAWIEKYQEGARNNLTTVALLPNNTDRPWFRHGVKQVEHYFYGDDNRPDLKIGCENRIKFDDPNPESKRTAPGKGNLLAIFRPPLPPCWH